ncbi:MAG: ABC transporter permease [Reichenbachiella sp.]|uniref:ABC transporter permease n=2 Tax=Reichenbachiella sp. TaxID=2184521 RepID=UPI0032652F54
MLKNYFKTSIRSLLKNPLNSFINLFGLSVATGICIVVYAFIQWDMSIDLFHKQKDEIYLTTFYVDRDGTTHQYGLSPTPIGALMRQDFAQIKRLCRLEYSNAIVKSGNDVFQESILFSDPEFLDMFTFPLKWGLSSSLSDMNSIIFSEEMAIKYFGDENPVGRDVLLKFGEGKGKSFTVSGVAEAFPQAHAIDFDFLINFENFKFSDPEYLLTDWKHFVNATFIQVEDPENLKVIVQGMNKYKALQNQAQKDWAVNSFAFEPLTTLHENSDEIRSDISDGASEEGRVVLSIIGIFMLALACLNYINIAITSATRRLKEIGIRKVVGANRRLVIIQFLVENIFITFLAMVIGLLLGVFIFEPWFDSLFDIGMDLKLFNVNLWLFLLSILALTGIASGIYPAFYISKFQAVSIFKGSLRFGKKNPLTKVFLAFQLILACITVATAIMLSQNADYQSERSWGYDQDRGLYIEVADESSYVRLREAMFQHPDVLSIAGAQHHLGRRISHEVIHAPDRQYEIRSMAVEPKYEEVLGLNIISGRFFKENSTSDKQAVVMNESLVKAMEIEQPIGHVIKIDSIRYQVIGVVEDFHIYSFYDEIRPTIFKMAEEKDYRYMVLQVKEGTQQSTYEYAQEQWASLFPEQPFEGGHQEDVFKFYFEELKGHTKLLNAVAMVAILLAGLGLYGLVSLNVAGRVREFSIRKALGAQLGNIVVNVTKQYIILILTALAIGAPVSYLAVEALMDLVYKYHMPMNFGGIFLSVFLLVIVLIFTMASQVGKVFRTNPVDGLRVE